MALKSIKEHTLGFTGSKRHRICGGADECPGRRGEGGWELRDCVQVQGQVHQPLCQDSQVTLLLREYDKSLGMKQ